MAEIRVTPRTVTALKRVVGEVLSPEVGSVLYLFGSRADPSRKGGDIDLLLVTDEETVRRSKDLRLELRARLREAAKDQRVDLVVAHEKDLVVDPFLATLTKKVPLGRW